MDKPMFLLKKFRGLSEENQKKWIKTIKSMTNSEKKKAISSYLQWNLTKDVLVNPCYTSSAVQDVFRDKISKRCEMRSWGPYWSSEISHEGIEIVKTLAPLTDNPNAPGTYLGRTPILYAADYGHTEIVKILASLTENPNAPSKVGNTPIHKAALQGHKEIIKILAPLTDNPNAPNTHGETPIYSVVLREGTEMVKFLTSLIDNPNVPNNDGDSPIHVAASRGYAEIVQILAPLQTILMLQIILELLQFIWQH